MKISLDTFFPYVYNDVMNLPADATTVNNTDGNTNNNTNNVVNKEAPKVIAPIRLPGIMSRGSNEDPVVPEEPVIENVVEDENGKKSVSTTEKENVTEDDNEEEVNEEENLEDEDGDDVSKDKTLDKPIKILGKTFKTLEEAEIYVNKRLVIASGAQSASAKQANEFKQRLEALETLVKNGKGSENNLENNVDLDPDTQQFWDDVKRSEAYIESVKDPAERARLRAILTATLVQHEVQKAEDRLSKMLTEKVSPIENERKATAEQLEVKSKAQKAFATVRDLVDDVTNLPAYPEFQNEEDLGEILSMWLQYKESGQIGDKVLYHPDFVMTLAHTYRDIKKSKTAPAKTNNGDGKPVVKKKAPTSHNLPPNLTKGNGNLGFTIPGVMGRR